MPRAMFVLTYGLAILCIRIKSSSWFWRTGSYGSFPATVHLLSMHGYRCIICSLCLALTTAASSYSGCSWWIRKEKLWGLVHKCFFCLCCAEDFLSLEENLSRHPWKLLLQIFPSARGRDPSRNCYGGFDSEDRGLSAVQLLVSLMFPQ